MGRVTFSSFLSRVGADTTAKYIGFKCSDDYYTSIALTPDGKMIVFGRVNAHDPTKSAGIWAVRSDSTNLVQLSPDGAYTRWVP